MHRPDRYALHDVVAAYNTLSHQLYNTNYNSPTLRIQFKGGYARSLHHAKSALMMDIHAAGKAGRLFYRANFAFHQQVHTYNERE